MTALPIGSAAELAASPEFADPTWRDSNGHNLLAVVLRALGAEAGWAMWREAEEMFLARGVVTHRALPVNPRPAARPELYAVKSEREWVL